MITAKGCNQELPGLFFLLRALGHAPPGDFFLLHCWAWGHALQMQWDLKKKKALFALFSIHAYRVEKKGKESHTFGQLLCAKSRVFMCLSQQPHKVGRYHFHFTSEQSLLISQVFWLPKDMRLMSSKVQFKTSPCSTPTPTTLYSLRGNWKGKSRLYN